MSKRDLTPAEKLWIEVFGHRGLPELDDRKVADIINSLPDRERLVVYMRFGRNQYGQSFRSIGEKLSLSRETVRLILKQALCHLKHPSRRKAWEEARK